MTKLFPKQRKVINMIDIMNVHCPHCSRDFAVDVYVGEESSNYNASLIRRNAQHVNWSEISEEIGKGYGNEILSVGDTISFYLKNNKQVSVSVAAINPYENNSVAFVFDDLFPSRIMNERGTNRGGWAKSDMADALENEILPLLPDELIEVIKPRTIIQVLDGIKYERTSKLWIPSRTEMVGKSEACKDCDFGDIHFPLFSTKKSRIKAMEDGTTDWYWLRSPLVGYAIHFWGVTSYGYIYNYGAGASMGVCSCFII